MLSWRQLLPLPIPPQLHSIATAVALQPLRCRAATAALPRCFHCAAAAAAALLQLLLRCCCNHCLRCSCRRRCAAARPLRYPSCRCAATATANTAVLLLPLPLLQPLRRYRFRCAAAATATTANTAAANVAALCSNAFVATLPLLPLPLSAAAAFDCCVLNSTDARSSRCHRLPLPPRLRRQLPLPMPP